MLNLRNEFKNASLSQINSRRRSLAELVERHEDWLTVLPHDLMIPNTASVVEIGGSVYVRVATHADAIALIRALRGKWSKAFVPQTGDTEYTRTFKTEHSVLVFEISSGTPAPSCVLTEVEEEVPAKKKTRYVLRCGSRVGK